MSKSKKSLLILLLTAMIWGFAFVAQLLGAAHLGPFTFNAIRFSLGSVSLVPVILIFEGRKAEKEKRNTTIVAGAAAGVILFAASTLQQFGVMWTGSAGKAGFLTGLYTVLVPLIGVFLHKKTNINIWIGAVLAVVGLYFVSFSDGRVVLSAGDAVLLLGAVLWALHIIVIDHFSDKIYSLRFAFTQFLVCAVCSAVCAAITEHATLSAVRDAMIPLLYAGLMSVGVAYTCQILGQRDADPTAASIVLSTESIFSAMGETLVLGLILHSDRFTPLTPSQYMGCGIIFCGIVFSQLPKKQQD